MAHLRPSGAICRLWLPIGLQTDHKTRPLAVGRSQAGNPKVEMVAVVMYGTRMACWPAGALAANAGASTAAASRAENKAWSPVMIHLGTPLGCGDSDESSPTWPAGLWSTKTEQSRQAGRETDVEPTKPE